MNIDPWRQTTQNGKTNKSELHLQTPIRKFEIKSKNQKNEPNNPTFKLISKVSETANMSKNTKSLFAVINYEKLFDLFWPVRSY